eukprot:scaffold3653_cov111-Isochrysis_galbana.AAC.1
MAPGSRGQRAVCGARAAAMLAHTVSLGVGMLRGLLERAILLFSIVDMMSVNGAAFRQVRVACETRNPHRSFSLPRDSRVSRRIRPLALLIFKKKILRRKRFAAPRRSNTARSTLLGAVPFLRLRHGDHCGNPPQYAGRHVAAPREQPREGRARGFSGIQIVQA